MSIANTAERYGRVAQIFHWSTALLILALLPMGVLMTWLPQGDAAEVAFKTWSYSLHKTVGVTVLAIAILRIVWAVINTRPEPLHPERKWETLAAETVHWMLYAGIILAPITGLAHHAASTGFAPIWWPLGQDIAFIPKDEQVSILFGYAHFGAVVAIGLSLLAHIGGALKHAFIDRDKTITRMVCGDDEVISLPIGFKTHHAPAFVLAAVALTGLIGGAVGYGVLSAAPRQAIDLTNIEPSVGQHSWIVDHQTSTLAISVDQLGSTVNGQFGNWSADINFDPEELASASVTVRIDTASLSIGTVSDQATGSDFLASNAFPQAVFTATNFLQQSDGAYLATGQLEIKGVTQPLSLPFSLSITDDVATMTAQVTVDRLAYTVGQENYANDATVGLDVVIDIAVTAQRAR